MLRQISNRCIDDAPVVVDLERGIAVVVAAVVADGDKAGLYVST